MTYVLLDPLVSHEEVEVVDFCVDHITILALDLNRVPLVQKVHMHWIMALLLALIAIHHLQMFLDQYVLLLALPVSIICNHTIYNLFNVLNVRQTTLQYDYDNIDLCICH